MILFDDLILEKKQIEKIIDLYENKLKSFPREKNGLISDMYRKTSEYIEAKKLFNYWFKKLQDINIYLLKNYKKEYLNYKKINK